MGSVIGEILPVALGVAISPVPVIAVILMLLAPRARAASVAFMVGWVLGMTVVVVVVTFVVDPVDDSSQGNPSILASVLKILLGLAVMLLGVRQWRARPREGEEPQMPKWMAAIDTVTPGKAFGLGALLSGVNPKNLVLCFAGGVSIGSAGLSTTDSLIAAAVFVVIGSCSVAVPVLAHLVAEDRMKAPLDELREWLTLHNTAVMSVLMLVIGLDIVGKGLAGL